MSEISELTDFISSVNFNDVPEAVKRAAIARILDTLSVAIGASREKQIVQVTDMYLQKTTKNNVSVWGRDYKSDLSTAVFLNAMKAHTLEMDDVHTKSKTHIGTVVIPAAWGVAEYVGASGREFLEAVLSGYETMSRIGMGFGVSSHRNLGWHVTATAGTFGAAAVAGKLLKLNREQLISALGLAGSQSFGTWAFLGDGASSKVLNPARAAQSGMEAAFLAKAGMSGPEHILTAEDGGLFHCMTSSPEPDKVTAGLGNHWEITEVDTKPYPSCRSTHGSIDAASYICQHNKVNSDEIEHVDVGTYLVGYKQCGCAEGSLNPKTPVNAKFSIPYTVACAILRGRMTLEELTPSALRDPEIRNLVQKIKVHPADEFTQEYPNHWGCRVKITLKTGKTLEHVVKDASGSVANPMSSAQMKDKAKGALRNAGYEKSEELIEVLQHIDQMKHLPPL
ncbi:MAG: MmgE/PrpD family protein [Acidaminococcus sp.]|nr:MmgE/PrpD family protein [Acidaminococcus sp.]MCI2099657.1 MmgE/PrpD family protein [Acidaminococcus sp.]MCI2113938.1 MmgE/PrpD family protein [Acidaminococcus sp.]MCI2115825.1 MmgE/PrpD family protein [Acidaminococcus sp.]